MLSLRNHAVRSLCKSKPLASIAARRLETTVATEGKPASTTTGKAPPASEEESYPLWLLGLVGGGFVLYFATPLFSANDGTGWITRSIQDWTKSGPVWEERHARHYSLVQEAIKERSLFHDSAGSRTIPDRTPERFNAHSPFNQRAGWSRGRSGEKLQEHYQEKYKEMDEESARLREAQN